MAWKGRFQTSNLDAGEPAEIVTDAGVSTPLGDGRTRRGLLRLAGGGALGLVSGLRLARLRAQEGSPEAEAEPDPEAEASGSPITGSGDLVVYSGRSETLVGPLIERFREETGLEVEVRYAGTPELAATILEEGDDTPADVFFSQDAGALGLLADEGLLAELPPELLDRVDPRFRSDEGRWVGTSGRARVLVYNTEELAEEELPASVLDLTGEEWRGRVGWAPENASFQSFVTALRVLEGEDAAREWLEGMLANDVQNYGDSNVALTRAVGAGEVAVGLVNHYYLYAVKEEEGEDYPIANHFFAAGDPGSLVNAAGVGMIDGAGNGDEALRFVEFLLGEEAQTYFADETAEYPLVAGVPTRSDLPPLAEVGSPEIDLSQLADLRGTLALLADVGVI